MRTGLGVMALLLAAAFAVPPAFGQRGGARTATVSSRSFTGKVAIEGGSAPAEPVVVESHCSSIVRKEATTDKQGAFGFTLGQGRGDPTAEANASRSASDASGENCVITASLPGYTSDVVELSRLPASKVDLGVIVLRRAAAGSAVSPTSGKAPKDAVKALDKGRDAAANKKWHEAERDFQKAVDLYPGYAEAWLQLGRTQVETKQIDEARRSFEASIKADDKYLPPYAALIAVESQQQDWKGVADVAERSIQLAPGSSLSVYLADAAAQLRLENLDLAEKRALEGIGLDQGRTQPKLYEVLASVQAARGDLAGAADQLKLYLQFAPFAADAATVRTQIGDLESQAAAQTKR